MKQRAIRQYREIERHYKRELNYMHPMMRDEQWPNHSIAATAMASSFYYATVDSEFQYWRSHARDVKRAQQLLDEIRELKKKIEAEGGSIQEAAMSS